MIRIERDYVDRHADLKLDADLGSSVRTRDCHQEVIFGRIRIVYTIECDVKHTYSFTGYAAGYGADANAASTLFCTSNELDTIELSVRHTFYRTKTSIKGAGYQNQIDTVYFTVPKRYLDTYGKLQKIKAEWWEYNQDKFQYGNT